MRIFLSLLNKRYICSGLLLLIAALAVEIVHAQGVQTLRMEGQPLVYVKDGLVLRCGIRVMGVEVSNSLAVTSTIDVSFNVDLTGNGFVKFVSGEGDPRRGKKNRLSSAWIKAPGQKATMPKGDVIPGDDGHSILYVTDGKSVLDLFAAQAEGKTLSIGIKKLGGSFEQIYVGVATMNRQEQQQVLDCLDELTTRLDKTTPK